MFCCSFLCSVLMGLPYSVTRMLGPRTRKIFGLWKIQSGLGQFMQEVGLPRWLSAKESACSAGDAGSIPGLGRFPWRRAWKPTPVFLPGESHGQRSLTGYSPWGSQSTGDDLVTKSCKMYLITILRGNEDLTDDLNLSWKWRGTAFAGAAKADIQGVISTACSRAQWQHHPAWVKSSWWDVILSPAAYCVPTVCLDLCQITYIYHLCYRLYVSFSPNSCIKTLPSLFPI